MALTSPAQLFGGKQFAEAAAGADRLRASVGQLVNAYNAAAASGQAWAVANAQIDLGTMQKQLAAADAAVQKLARSIGEQLGAAIKGTFQGTLVQGLGVFGRLQGLMASTLQVAAPSQWIQLQRTYADLAAVIGRTLLPVFEQFRAVLRATADFILNLDPTVKKLVVTVAELALAFAVGSKALTLLGTVAGPVFAALELGFAALIGEATALDVLMGGLPILFGLLTAALGAFVVVGSQAGEGGSAIAAAWKEVREALAPIAAMIGELVTQLTPLAEMVGSVLVKAFEQVVSAIKQMVDAAAMAFAIIEVGLQKLSARDFTGFTDDVTAKFKQLTNRQQGERPQQSSVGLAAAPAQMTTLAGLGEEARRSAFQTGGGGKTEAERAAEAAKKAEDQRREQIDLLKKIAGGDKTVELDPETSARLDDLAAFALRLKF